MSDDVVSGTPLMRQYHEVKNRFPDALVLFQVGDFYELFFDDAQKASAFLGITLTKRGSQNGEPIPLCGVPVHAVDHYLVKLVRGGFRVVLCDQLTKPQAGKLVERGIRQVLTPGTLTDLKMLQEKSASYLAAVFPLDDRYGIAFTELLAGQIFVTVLDSTDDRLLEAELSRFLPDEIIVPDTKLGIALNSYLQKLGYVTTAYASTPAVLQENEVLRAWLTSYFPEGITSFIDHSQAACSALGLMHAYLTTHCQAALGQCKQIFVYSPEDFLILDAATQRNLELVKNLQDGTSDHTLFSLVDKALSPMGSRQIKKWLLRPLVKQELIEQRLDAVDMLLRRIVERSSLEELLKSVGDLERVVGRIALGRAQIYDYLGLMRALVVIPKISQLLDTCGNVQVLHIIKARLADFQNLLHVMQTSLNEDSEQHYRIKPGFDPELDRLRVLLEKGTSAILELERAEQARTRIPSLKIRYSKLNGYAIEVTKTYLDHIPSDYIRLQTLTNRERFTIQALKDLEYDMNRARASVDEVEQEIFNGVCKRVEQDLASLKKTAQALAHLDALVSLATVAYMYSYTRPQFNKQRDIIIHDGRHPVVDASLRHQFIPNNTALTDQDSLWIITGPNMGGKSTYLRQVALIAILAQMGSFVPASLANLPLIDRIFTRIGAADNVAAGKSTFLVEMEEAALICTQATPNSLVILDEVGRGTSTYDGLALAQAIIEYIYTHVQARCLFATHYHELTALVPTHPGIGAYYAASKQTKEGVLLLHKIMRGASDGSFGLEVAKRAGIPDIVVQRAGEILKNIKTDGMPVVPQAPDTGVTPAVECMLCTTNHKLKQELAELNLDSMSPRQAWEVLSQLKSNAHNVAG